MPGGAAQHEQRPSRRPVERDSVGRERAPGAAAGLGVGIGVCINVGVCVCIGVGVCVGIGVCIGVCQVQRTPQALPERDRAAATSPVPHAQEAPERSLSNPEPGPAFHRPRTTSSIRPSWLC